MGNHGEEPVLWIDKCCIDQNNIDESLRCLPIFLSGCQRLVVLLGSTCLTRLWCIIELFTFVHMCKGGDNPMRIECVPMVDALTPPANHANVLRRFDARLCECFAPEEKSRMLQIIRAAYGQWRSFNNVVIKSLQDALPDFFSVDLPKDSDLWSQRSKMTSLPSADRPILSRWKTQEAPAVELKHDGLEIDAALLERSKSAPLLQRADLEVSSCLRSVYSDIFYCAT